MKVFSKRFLAMTYPLIGAGLLTMGRPVCNFYFSNSWYMSKAPRDTRAPYAPTVIW